ncbi:MAG: protein kinase [Bryobacteraceae bacterium]
MEKGQPSSMGPAKVIECPQCGSTYPDGTLSCSKCRTPFDVPTVIAEVTHGGTVRMDPFAPSAAGNHFAPGSILGDRYEIVATLGEGGMGTVYKALDRELDRLVALKVIRPELARDPEILDRFKKELILSRKISHRNVIRIFDLGLAGGTKFISMDFIDGKDLMSKLRAAGKLEPREAAQIMADVCRGLAAAHAEGVVHRDLKPQNIMMDPRGHPVVMDFGIASSLEDHSITRTGVLMGTPTYMSPEQAMGTKADARSDLFTFGVIFYELLTGDVPFKSETMMGQLLQRVQERAQPPIAVNPNIPAVLSDIVSKCLQPKVADRYQSANQIVYDLDAWLDPATSETVRITLPAGAVTAAPTVKVPASKRVIPRRHWMAAGAAAALVLLIAGVLTYRANFTGPPANLKPVTMLIADFANTTGDPVFDGTIEPMLSIAMEGASFITSYNRGEAHRVSAQLNGGNTKMDEAKAYLVASRQGINVVIGGSIDRKDDNYVVRIRAIDGLSGKEIVAREASTSKKEDVLGAVGKLAAPIRRALGDASPESAKLAAAETFSASSVDAAHEYAMAQEFQFAARWDDAIRSYNKAIQLDPTFGRAYAGLAVVNANLGQRDQAAQYFQKAMAHIDRMTEREKFRTRASYYLAVRNTQSAIDELSKLVQQYPSDSAALNNLAVAYSYRRDMTKAVEVARRAAAIYPKSALPLMNVAAFSLYAGDWAGAAKEARAVLEINPKYAKAYIVLGMTLLAQGKPGEAEETYRKAQELSARGASYSANGLSDLALYQGRLADASAILQEAIRADEANLSASFAAVKMTLLAQTLLQRGQKPAALALVEKALAAGKQEENLLAAAEVYLAAGQEGKAKALAAELRSRLGQDFQAYAKLIDGQIELQRGNARGAIDLFKESIEIADTWMGHLGLGRAYLGFNAFTEAHSEFSTCMSRRGEAAALYLDEVPTYREVGVLQYYLARALEGLKSPGATDAYKVFLASHKVTNEDPLAIDAQRRLGGKLKP